MSGTNAQIPNPAAAASRLPEEFTIEDLRNAGFEPEEISALATGSEDNPALIIIEDPADADAPTGDKPDQPAIGDAPADQAKADTDATTQQVQQQDLPKVEIPDTTEAERVVAQLDSALEALQSKYDDGELSKTEFSEQTKALIAEQTRAQILIDTAAQAVNTAKQSAEQIFYAAQDKYYKAGAAELVSPEHFSAWDRHLRDVTGNAAFASLNAEQLIRLAHSRYAAEYEVINGKPLAIPLPGVTAPPAKLETRTDQRPEAIQTLGRVNGDLNDAIADSRFAQIDAASKSDPMLAESLLAKMSPEDQERYLMSA